MDTDPKKENEINPEPTSVTAESETFIAAPIKVETSDKNIVLPFGIPNNASVPAAEDSKTNPFSDSPPPLKPKKTKLFLVISGVIILLVIACAAIFSYAIAYEKLDIPNYPKVKAFVTNSVMSLPFMPKTPKYLIAKTLIAHEKVSKHDYNISVSAASPGFADITGLSQFDMETKGSIDYENSENVIFQMETSLTKDLNVEIKKPDNFLYFKINKIPAFLLAIVGLQPQQFDPILGKWIAYDTTPLQTAASEELKKDTEVQSLSEDVLSEFEAKYLNGTVVKKLKIENVSEDNRDFYKLSINFDKETLDYLEKTLDSEKPAAYSADSQAKLSDVIKEMNWSMYINTKTFLTHKITVTSEMEIDQISPTYGSAFLGTSDSLTQNSKVKFALVLKFDKFGEDVVIEKPAEFMSFEEFTSQFSEIMKGVYAQFLNPSLTSVTDDKKRSDISTIKIVLELYKADCGTYPTSLNELVTPPQNCPNARGYLLQLPTDPTGENYYYKQNTEKDGYDICTNLDTPVDIPLTCPDPAYNYHVAFP